MIDNKHTVICPNCQTVLHGSVGLELPMEVLAEMARLAAKAVTLQLEIAPKDESQRLEGN